MNNEEHKHIDHWKGLPEFVNEKKILLKKLIL